MCDPATMTTLAISAATTAGKTIMDSKAQKAVQKSQQAAQRSFNEDLEKQRGQANVSFQDSIAAASKPEADKMQNNAVAQRTAAAEPSFNQNTLLPGQGNSSNAVRTSITQSQGQGAEGNKSASAREALLRSFGDAEFGRDIRLGQNANRIGTQGKFAEGSLRTLQSDLDASQTAGNKYSMIGDLVNAAGTIGQIAAPGLITEDMAGFVPTGKVSKAGVPIPTAKPLQRPLPGIS